MLIHEKDVDLLRLPFQHMNLLSSAGSSDHTLVYPHFPYYLQLKVFGPTEPYAQHQWQPGLWGLP